MTMTQQEDEMIISSAHLPLIIRSGELRPGAPVGNFAEREFVHATENPAGDRTAFGFSTWQDSFDLGKFQRVRGLATSGQASVRWYAAFDIAARRAGVSA